MKTHDLHTVIINHIPVNYFYHREKNDINRTPRFRVYIIDPETPAIYETIFKCYNGQIEERVIHFVEGAEKC